MRVVPLSALLLAPLLLFAATAYAADPGPPAAQSTPCPSGQAPTPSTLDLNGADEQALLGLPGIGPSRARAIVAFRTAHGPFRSLSQLLQIKGIGRALLKQLRPLVTLSAASS